MEEILIELMNEKCKAMLNNKSRCFKKKACDGQCGYFQNALCKLNTTAYIDMCNIKNQLKQDKYANFCNRHSIPNGFGFGP